MMCSVCRGHRVFAEHDLGVDGYWRCPDCLATILDPVLWLAAGDEHAHYLHHENDPSDPRYRNFLSRAAVPLLDRLTPGLSGLDYGCGPGPALAQMLTEAGHSVAVYDPFFFPDTTVLSATYDFITCTEAAEHFHRPAEEFDRLNAMLKPGGWLAIMTCFQTDDARFANWHYRRDPTHVVFYREQTFQVIARQRGWSCNSPVKDVVLIQKQPKRSGEQFDAA